MGMIVSAHIHEAIRLLGRHPSQYDIIVARDFKLDKSSLRCGDNAAIEGSMNRVDSSPGGPCTVSVDCNCCNLGTTVPPFTTVPAGTTTTTTFRP